MMVTQSLRYDAQATLRAYYARNGVQQVRADGLGADGVEVGWVRYARCGQQNPDALDPESFHAVEADTNETYAAQKLCLTCPVRDLCDRDGDENKRPGVWGGIYREDSGYPALLCQTAGCLNYRRRGRGAKTSYDLCRSCQTARDTAEAAEREAARRAAEERRAAVPRTPSGKISTGRPVGRRRKTSTGGQPVTVESREVVPV